MESTCFWLHRWYALVACTAFACTLPDVLVRCTRDAQLPFGWRCLLCLDKSMSAMRGLHPGTKGYLFNWDCTDLDVHAESAGKVAA